MRFGTTIVTIVSDNGSQIVAIAPAGMAGTINTTVTTAGGTSALSAADHFTYIAMPVVSGIRSAQGTTTGGTSVTITGTNLAGAIQVLFGKTPAKMVHNSANQIVVSSPAGSGMVDVTVRTAFGASATSAADLFSYLAAPTVTAVSPKTGCTTGGTQVHHRRHESRYGRYGQRAVRRNRSDHRER